MSLRIVLLTRSGRPSGAQMAWRLFESGMAPVAVIVEKRGHMIAKRKESILSLVLKLGIGFFWRKIKETLQIKSHFYLRKLLRGRFKDPAYLSIEELALDYPVRIYEVEDHNSAEVKELLWRLEPDIGILTNTRRIKKEILGMPRHGFFNLHLSALPQYAGLDAIFWALYHEEREIGVTVHFAAEEIDRGDIVCQRKIPVSPLDNEESLYTKALWLGTYLMVQALTQLREGTLERKQQDRHKASYFSWPTPKDRTFFRKRYNQRGEQKKEGVQVLHIITRMIRGGAQENTLASVRGLKEKGYQVTLVTGSTWGNEGEIISEALQEGLDLVILPELIREISPWKDFLVIKKLLALLSKNNYTIVHTHTSKAGFLGRLAARIKRIPIVIHTPHGHVFHSYFSPWKERLFLAIERKAAEWSERLIALTQAERKEHLDLQVGESEKWCVIPSGVNEKFFQELSPVEKNEIRSAFDIPEGRKIVGFIGRFAPIKGPKYFLEAIPKIMKIFPQTHFLFVGDGQERRGFEDKVHEMGISSFVTFTGHQERVSDFLNILDLLVVPSLNEGMGRIIAEGGLLGKPVIGTRVGGIPDLIEDHKTGLLVTPRSSDEIAEAVIGLLEDSSLCRELGKRLREKVLAGFTEVQMVEKIHRLYQEVLAKKGISCGAALKDQLCQEKVEAEEGFAAPQGSSRAF